MKYHKIKEWADNSNVVNITILLLKLCPYYNQLGDSFSFPINPIIQSN